MHALLLIIHLLQVYADEEYSRNYCSIYTCKPPTMKFDNITCIYPHLLYSTYYLFPCPSSFPYCPPKTFSLVNVTCSAIPPKATLSSYPGEPCNINSDCLFGTCLSGVCFGANNGETCTSSSQCNPGSRCQNNICTDLIPIGKIGCTTDYDCVPSAGCMKNSSATYCAPYFSVPSGDRVTSCIKASQGGYSNLCKTGVCLVTNSKTSMGQCSDAPKSFKPQPQECLSNNDCQGFTNDFNYTGICTCGINPYATSYCQPFMGDLIGVNYLNAYKKFLLKNYVIQCNTMRRFSSECWSLFATKTEMLALAKNKFLYENYPLLQNNDVCIQEVYFASYYGIENFSGVLYMVSLWMIS